VTFTTDPATKSTPFTVSVNAGPPVATTDGEIELITGATPVPDSVTSIFAVAELEKVTSSVALSNPTVVGLNVMPRAHELPTPEGRMIGNTEVHCVPLVGATRAKSAELVDAKMLMLLTLSAGFPSPMLEIVPLIGAVVRPSGTLPNGTAFSPAPTGSGEAEKNGMGPLANPRSGTL
jgi:hypothetical protein